MHVAPLHGRVTYRLTPASKGPTQMTKTELLAKMNRRHGTDIGDYFMMLVWLKRAAESNGRLAARLPRSGEAAAEYRADYAELLNADEPAATPEDGIDAVEDRAHERAMRELVTKAAEEAYDDDPSSNFDESLFREHVEADVCRYCQHGNEACVCP